MSQLALLKFPYKDKLDFTCKDMLCLIGPVIFRFSGLLVYSTIVPFTTYMPLDRTEEVLNKLSLPT